MNSETPPASTEPEKKPKGGTSPWLILLAGFLGALLGVFVGAITTALITSEALPLPDGLVMGKAKTSESGELQTLKPNKDAVVTASHQIRPSVVNIRSSFEESDSFHDDMEVKGQGSGVIFRSDGYILTNGHVVEEAKEIFVTLPNGKDVKGKVLGIDADNDIAVIKVNEKGLPAARFGKSRELRVGELAVAVGSPFGLEHTVTTGVVSALHRNVSAGDDRRMKTLTNLIQTDAAINPGNSGGALTNHEGKVIGINTLIFTTNGSGQGIGFAIPSEYALGLANQIIKRGKTSRPYIGVCVANVDESVAKELKLKVTKGALITELLDKSPAKTAGIKKDDVVVSADSRRVNTAEDLIASVRSRTIGETISLEIMRKAKTLTIDVKLADKPAGGESGCTAGPSPTDKSGKTQTTPPGHP